MIFHYKRRKRHANICTLRLFPKKKNFRWEIIPNFLALIIVTNSFWNHSDMTTFAKHCDCQVCSVFLVYCWFHWVMVTIQFTKNVHLSCIHAYKRGESTSLQACWKGMLLATWKNALPPPPPSPRPFTPRPFNNYYRCFGLGVNEGQAISLVISAWRVHSTTNTLWFTGIQKRRTQRDCIY